MKIQKNIFCAWSRQACLPCWKDDSFEADFLLTSLTFPFPSTIVPTLLVCFFITIILNEFSISRIYCHILKQTESNKTPDDYTVLIFLCVSGMGLLPEIQILLRTCASGYIYVYLSCLQREAFCQCRCSDALCTFSMSLVVIERSVSF